MNCLQRTVSNYGRFFLSVSEFMTHVFGIYEWGKPRCNVKWIIFLHFPRPRWVVPVLPKGELEVLLEAAIELSKKGKLKNKTLRKMDIINNPGYILKWFTYMNWE